MSTTKEKEIWEAMVDPAIRGPLQSRFMVDRTGKNFVEAQPIAVEQEELWGDSVVIKPQIAVKVLDEVLREDAFEMGDREESARNYNNLLKKNPRALGPYGG